MRRVGNTVAMTMMAVASPWFSIKTGTLSPKGSVMLLELLEDGLMVVFVIATIDGVVREYPSLMTFVSGFAMLLGVLFIE